ncbi:MAG: hypothetical protein JOZ54_04810 [Acidobacteria bacterium]|nr:hypothetical protein [Acidobacteriota bacterium]
MKTMVLTVRRRIYLYLIFAALGGLACAGVDFTIDANRMNADVKVKDDLECALRQNAGKCTESTFSNGVCHLKACARPPDNPSNPVTNCAFGSTNGSRPWTASDCRTKIVGSQCTEGTLYSIGCYGYTCKDGRCGR